MSSVRSTAVPSDFSAFQDRAERERYRRARAQARRQLRADSARREHSVAPPSADVSPFAGGWPVRHLAAAPAASPAPLPVASGPSRMAGLLTRLGLV